MLIPLWAANCLGASFATTAAPLLQEKFKSNGFALAFWSKIFLCIFILPFVLVEGLPKDPLFYAWIAATALLYSVSDVIYYSAIPHIGSGLMSRLLPSAVIMTFILWFIVNPSSLQNYLNRPWQAAGIAGTLMLFAFFATRIKKCHVSWQGVKRVWFVILAACIGPVLTKMALNHAPVASASYSFMLIQALMMIFCWTIFYTVKKPITKTILFSKHSLRSGIIISMLATVALFFKMQGYLLADNPAYASILFFCDTLWIPVIYKVIGRKDPSNLWAGLGIVGCAATLIILKSL
jgi:hypothetical protein